MLCSGVGGEIPRVHGGGIKAPGAGKRGPEREGERPRGRVEKSKGKVGTGTKGESAEWGCEEGIVKGRGLRAEKDGPLEPEVGRASRGATRLGGAEREEGAGEEQTEEEESEKVRVVRGLGSREKAGSGVKPGARH